MVSFSIAYVPYHHVAHLVTCPPWEMLREGCRTVCGCRVTHDWRIVPPPLRNGHAERPCAHCLSTEAGRKVAAKYGEGLATPPRVAYNFRHVMKPVGRRRPVTHC